MLRQLLLKKQNALLILPYVALVQEKVCISQSVMQPEGNYDVIFVYIIFPVLMFMVLWI